MTPGIGVERATGVGEMRKGSAVVIAAGMFLAACGGDGEPTNAERPDDVVDDTTDVLDEVEVPTPTAVPVVVEPEQLTYTVQPGDLLSTIAQNFGLTVDQLLAANPEVTDPNVIQVGDELVIPDASADTDSGADTGTDTGTGTDADTSTGTED